MKMASPQGLAKFWLSLVGARPTSNEDEVRLLNEPCRPNRCCTNAAIQDDKIDHCDDVNFPEHHQVQGNPNPNSQKENDDPQTGKIPSWSRFVGEMLRVFQFVVFHK
jgi:hypothetical protein